MPSDFPSGSGGGGAGENTAPSPNAAASNKERGCDDEKPSDGVPSGYAASPGTSGTGTWTFSLRTVIVLLILSVGILVSVATLVPVYLSARTAVDTAMGTLRAVTMSRIYGTVRAEFDYATLPVTQFASLFEAGVLNPLWDSPDDMQVDAYQRDVLMPALCGSVFGQERVFFSYIGNDRGDFMACSPPYAYTTIRGGVNRSGVPLLHRGPWAPHSNDTYHSSIFRN